MQIILSVKSVKSKFNTSDCCSCSQYKFQRIPPTPYPLPCPVVELLYSINTIVSDNVEGGKMKENKL